MENRKPAGMPVIKYEKPQGRDMKSRRPAGKSVLRPGKPVSKGKKKEITQIRLNRFIANSGVCSRRDADEHIRNGLITVNGRRVTDLGTKVSYDDEVRYKNKRLSAEKKVVKNSAILAGRFLKNIIKTKNHQSDYNAPRYRYKNITPNIHVIMLCSG